MLSNVSYILMLWLIYEQKESHKQTIGKIIPNEILLKKRKNLCYKC